MWFIHQIIDFFFSQFCLWATFPCLHCYRLGRFEKFPARMFSSMIFIFLEFFFFFWFCWSMHLSVDKFELNNRKKIYISYGGDSNFIVKLYHSFFIFITWVKLPMIYVVESKSCAIDFFFSAVKVDKKRFYVSNYGVYLLIWFWNINP